jgi:ADP-ribosylglycohydrolase
MKINQKDISACLLGDAIGEALGAPIEFFDDIAETCEVDEH